jgi:myo-inositol-1(or 4)-monophosphatase
VVANFPRDAKIEGDLRLHRLITERLAKDTQYPVLSEEGSDHQAAGNDLDYRWIVDPLDGSINFSRGIPFSCISIALWRGMKPLLGVVYDMNRDELFSGFAAGGAWLNGEPVRVSDTQAIGQAILVTGFPTGGDFSSPALLEIVREVQSFKKVRLLGAAALSLAYVACGRADAYQENDIAIWDVAAGLAIAMGAGGVASFRRSGSENRLIVRAANDRVFHQMAGVDWPHTEGLER